MNDDDDAESRREKFGFVGDERLLWVGVVGSSSKPFYNIFSREIHPHSVSVASVIQTSTRRDTRIYRYP